MRMLDILGMGFRNLLRRKTRTFLTVIGVVVGAAAIVIMLSLGIAMNENLNKSIANMGDLTIIDLYENAWRPSGGDTQEWMQSQNTLDAALLEKIKSWDEVLAATPYINFYDFDLLIGQRYGMQWANVVGIDSAYLPYMKIQLESGYMPQPGDENWILFGARMARMVINLKRPPTTQKDYDALNNPDFTKPPKINLLKENIYAQIRNNQYGEVSPGVWGPLPLKGRIKKHSIDKVGIIKFTEDQSKGIWDEHQYMIYMDYNVIVQMQAEFEKATKVKAKDSKIGKFSQIRIKVKDVKASEIVQKRLMDDEGIMVNYGLADMRDEMQKTQRTMQMILGGIGAMSLLVAAIGIANTMFMSIYERTKEIGVMKVLGCPLGGIKSMFLFEASIIGFFGGLVGSGLSMIGSNLMNNYEPIKKALGSMSGSNNFYGGNSGIESISVIPLWLIVLAVVFATVIGLVSGYLPARRATKISALEAIRNE